MGKSNIKRIAQMISSWGELIISMAGFVPSHATLPRIIAFVCSLGLSFYLTSFHPGDSRLALIYFVISEVSYIGFIILVLPENGLRLWFLKRWKNEQEGYLVYEAVLGILFFHNAMSMGYLASSTEGQLSYSIGRSELFIIVLLPFVAGFLVKIFAAKAVGIDIYYWKDMFLGRKICGFIVAGPYRYLSNPMYGIGQIQAYAAALWYASAWGLASAVINQGLIFIFYFFFEKKFIRRVYLDNQYNLSS